MREKLDDFFQKYGRIERTTKHVILRSGAQPKGVYYLEQGHVREYDIANKSGNELTLHIFNPGSLFPLIWALNETPNRFFFETIGATTYRVAPRSAFLAFLRQEPELMLWVTKRILAGLDGLMSRVEYQVFGDAHARVAAELVYLARHFGKPADKSIEIYEPFTHQNIADLTGMVRETVSVAMEKLVHQGRIHYQGNKIVIDAFDELVAELDSLV